MICPRIEGHRRLYSIQEVVALSTIKQLRTRGLSLQAVRRILRSLRKQLDPMVPAIVGGAVAILIVDARATRVDVFVGTGNALSHVMNMTTPAIVIAIGPELWKILPAGARRVAVA